MGENLKIKMKITRDKYLDRSKKTKYNERGLKRTKRLHLTMFQTNVSSKMVWEFGTVITGRTLVCTMFLVDRFIVRLKVTGLNSLERALLALKKFKP